MARNEIYTCDICRKHTEQIVRKLFISPAGTVAPNNSRVANYTHHLDVGVCCENEVMRAFNWHKRMSAEEYNRKRRRERK